MIRRGFDKSPADGESRSMRLDAEILHQLLAEQYDPDLTGCGPGSSPPCVRPCGGQGHFPVLIAFQPRILHVHKTGSGAKNLSHAHLGPPQDPVPVQGRAAVSAPVTQHAGPGQPLSPRLRGSREKRIREETGHSGCVAGPIYPGKDIRLCVGGGGAEQEEERQRAKKERPFHCGQDSI